MIDLWSVAYFSFKNSRLKGDRKNFNSERAV